MKRLLEVESKFRFQSSLLPHFRSNRGNPPFDKLRFLGIQIFEDTYYDHANTLTQKGIWLRKRVDSKSKVLEVKKRVTGNYNRSVFEEIRNLDEIDVLIRRHFPDCSTAEQNYGLDILAQFKTTRTNYVADERFSLVLDDTDFGHSVGEVELQAEDATLAHQDIDLFLQKYSWFCQQGSVEGKLSAYLRLHESKK